MKKKLTKEQKLKQFVVNLEERVRELKRDLSNQGAELSAISSLVESPQKIYGISEPINIFDEVNRIVKENYSLNAQLRRMDGIFDHDYVEYKRKDIIEDRCECEL